MNLGRTLAIAGRLQRSDGELLKPLVETSRATTSG
jgi:hypothetical protein